MQIELKVKRSRVSRWLWVYGLLIIGAAGLMVGVTQPLFGALPDRSSVTVSEDELRAHVVMLSETFAPRSYKHIRNLNGCADYIATHLREAGGRVSIQPFSARGRDYQNVIAEFGPVDGALLVVGAHYDSYGSTPGADDNASGVAGLLELADLLGQTNLNRRVALVAFTLEEPPFFRTPDMGSARYVKMLMETGTEVEAMICLEMIGTFSEEEGSQQYPSVALKWLYPDRGNFIALIGRPGDRPLIAQMKRTMRGATDLPVHSMCAPARFPGVDFSDHQNFWNAGIRAVMVTDTAFHRNLHYHGDGDTADRLNYRQMAKVVVGVYESVLMLMEQ
jgi:Zn-dependent M28 family amino/carboxypeptidase